MNELFPAEQVAVDSPRLRWMKKHELTTLRNEGVQPGDECEITGARLAPWCAHVKGMRFPMPGTWAGYGDTEDDAIADWAKKHNVRLWNEE